MPYRLEAQSISSINGLLFVLEEGTITKLLCRVSVNYGDRSLDQDVDLWGYLSPEEKSILQKVDALLQSKIIKVFLS